MTNPYYNEKDSSCPDCFGKISKYALEHTCASKRVADETSSTAASDYASLDIADVVVQPIYHIDESSIKIPDVEIRPGKWIPIDGSVPVYPTICKSCGSQTNWNYPIQGAHWICMKCNYINEVNKITSWVNTDKIVIYLSGPMSGYPDFNYPAFHEYAEKYRTKGFTVISPPELADAREGTDYETCLRRDIHALLDEKIQRIYLLPGWQESKGANLEVHLAKLFKIPLYDAETGELFIEDVAQEARRLVMGDRRKDYGSPLEDFERTSGMINSAFNHKINEPFTAEDISLMMIIVKLSRLINSPDHWDSGVDITGYDLVYWLIRNERRDKEVY